MLTNTLNTNEVKNRLGTEVEFVSIDDSGTAHVFKASAEQPNLQHRLRVAHSELSSNEDARRRSNLSISKEITGVSGKKRKIIGSYTLDIPVGDIDDLDDVKDVNAEMLSLLATTGAATTVLFDGTGNGSVCLINGEK